MANRKLTVAAPRDLERVDFDLTYTVQGADGREERTETFTVQGDVGLGAVLAWKRARADQHALAQPTLLRVLVDDDGLTSKYRNPRIEQGDPRAEAGEMKVGNVDNTHPDYDPRAEDRTTWSSLLRFSDLLTDRTVLIPTDALPAVVDALVEEAAKGRPTARSTR